MSTVKVPYTMYCPNCKTGLKIKSEKMIGTDIHCPKCNKRIQVVTPEEDGHIPYTVKEEEFKSKNVSLDENLMREWEENRLKEERKQKVAARYHWAWAAFWAVCLGVIIWIFWEYVVPYYREEYKAQDHRTAKKRERRVGFVPVPVFRDTIERM